MTPSLSSELSTRPICASVWVKKPAKTSCWRDSIRRSSAGRSFQAWTHAGRSVSSVPRGTTPESTCRGEQLLPPGVPPLVEHTPVGVDPLGRHMVGRVHGPEREVEEEGLARCALLLVLHHADGLVGQVLAEVVPVLGASGRVDVVVVAHQVGGPVVGVALQEPVVPFEAQAERPGVERPGGRALPAGCEVPLADGERRVPDVAQDPGSGAAVRGSRAW